MALFERVRAVVMDKMDAQETDIEPSTSFVDDLNADSLDLAELILAFQEEFDLEISQEDAKAVETIQNVVDYLKGRGVSDA